MSTPTTPLPRLQPIQDGLTSLMQLQRALWRNLPILEDAVLQSLDRINVDRQLLGQEIRQEIRRSVARILATRSVVGLSWPSRASFAHAAFHVFCLCVLKPSRRIRDLRNGYLG